jgi:predicted metal-dependent hydrolase
MDSLSWPETFLSGETIPYSGYRWTLSIKHGAQSQTLLRDRCLQITLPLNTRIVDYAKAAQLAALDWLKQQAERTVQANINLYSQKMGRAPRRFGLKATKSRWGSLGIHNDLYINWLLILGPGSVLEYVVVHEMSHLFYRSHGPRFWGVVQKWMPEYRQAEKWLREHGRHLMENLNN